MQVERLINRHKDSVYRQMVRVCGNHEDAEDALATAIFAALKASDQLRDPENFRGWLSRIGSRACSRMRIRDKLVHFSSLEDLQSKGFDLPDHSHDHQNGAIASQIKDCVAQAIQLLPPMLREVYVRREIGGESAEEVSQALGLTVAAMKTRLHRARKLVRESLDSGLGCSNLVD